MAIKILGAGMAGLLAGGMLRNAQIYEAQSALPNNHSAVLRFRSSVVGDTLGIPFSKVKVMRAKETWKNDIADAVAYSIKCNGTPDLRSITAARGDIVDRFIAPDDLISRMAQIVDGRLHFGQEVNASGIAHLRNRGCSIISTVPMPVAMDLLGWNGPLPNFRHVSGTNVVAVLNPDIDLFCSLYVPDPAFPGSRISVTGNIMTIEVPRVDIAELNKQEEDGGSVEDMVSEAAEMLGLDPMCVQEYTLKSQKYAKIMPIDERLRKQFMMWATETHSFYSLGRFATWKPGLLLDDVVNDVHVIRRMIGGDVTAMYNSKKDS